MSVSDRVSRFPGASSTPSAAPPPGGRRDVPGRSRHAFGLAILVGAFVAGSVGPRLLRPSGRAAGVPFTYTPPADFVPADPAVLAAIQASAPSIRSAWLVPSPVMVTSRPSLNVLHAPRREGVEVADLEAIAEGMPAVLEAGGGSWRTERIAREMRLDGAPVGWIEGACTKGEIAYRSLELVFPDDEGTSFVTATLPVTGPEEEEDREKWNAAFLASVQTATGVARRAVPAPAWLHLAWAAGGALLVVMASGIVGRRRSRGGLVRRPNASTASAPPVVSPMYERTDASEP